ncbi:Aldo/keto reductase [Sinomonas atrocyanea]|uniref:Aldo/keto reductase n=1 Tax=Sinomonas atrocyanea TaxID=37927 RepID=A0A127A728_9MICC|nr:Aldo/keto reductase [Sinomonas atrocyanea]GEB63072.1 aldo/keto reductase [Sinomonas atrocyanea]GGG72618.1 aldo/keto reductase [Sinomonas atrocyanea]
MASRLIYGCMGLGGPWDAPDYGPQQVAEAEKAVEAALALGITRFDHADIYGRGKSEAVFGELLRQDPGLRDRVQLQSKVGIRLGGPGGFGHYDLSAAAILDGVAGTLRRLRTDYLDVLLLHRPDPLLDPAEVGSALARLIADGAVRAVGVSNMSAAQMAALQDHLHVPLAADQLELSLHRHDFVDSAVLVNHPDGAATSFPHGTLEHCLRHGIEVQAWSPLAGGRYTGRTAAHAGPHDGAAAALVAELAAAKGTTGEAVVLGWLLRHPARISPVIGSANPQRIAACADAEAVAGSMTREEWFTLYQTARGRSIP